MSQLLLPHVSLSLFSVATGVAVVVDTLAHTHKIVKQANKQTLLCRFMPPPPPPSASYLLVLDSDSEDEDQDTLAEVNYPPDDDAPPPTVVGLRRPHFVEDDDDDDDDDTDDVDTSMEEHESSTTANDDDNNSGKLSKSQKRRQRAKRKTKKKSKTDEDTDNQSNGAKVSFSNVSIRTYPRAFSPDAVPADGCWPLGMSLDRFEDEEPIELEEFETCKQQALKERWEAMLEASNSSPSSSPSPTKHKTTTPSSSGEKKSTKLDPEVIKLVESLHGVKLDNRPNTPLPVFETRQWDYRGGVKNPLFGSLSETKRQALFLAASGGSEEEQQLKQKEQQNGGTSFSKGQRPRSNSVTSGQTSKHGHNTRRSRSNSGTNMGTNSSNFNDTYNQVYVMHVRNELEQLRNDRNKSGATGCNCRKLNVYLPPKDGSAGKKAQHKRLKPSKLQQELKKRNLFDETMSREEMEKVLHKAVEQEPCCRDDDCFCVRNGIDCQADACSCWHDSHVHVKRYSDSEPLSTKEIEQRCGNPLGMYVVDLDGIGAFRSKIIKNQKLEALFCMPVSSAVEAGQ
jgi:hypothetical protein